MIEKGDFRFRDDMIKPEDVQTGPVEILTVPYKNVIYRYVKVGVKERMMVKLFFSFSMIYSISGFSETTLRNDQRFTNDIGLNP
jgi:hypothetical protein